MAKSAATGSHEMPSVTVLARRRGELRTTVKTTAKTSPFSMISTDLILFGGDGLTEADM